MKQTLEAIYEKGVLKPLKRLTLPEGRHVIISVETTETSGREEAAASASSEVKKYDFSDLLGTLSWKGDPVKAQRELRDEW
jgi:predicted DNA-binding antitoxin AbrB/MazE fold protein